VLAPAEAEALLLRRTGDADQAAATALAEELDGLPLALEQAATYCEQTSLGLTDYLARYRRAHARLLDKGAPGDYPAMVATTWRLNVDQAAKASVAAVQLLRLGAFLAPEAIPPDLLGADPKVLPAELAQAVGDELALDEAVGALYRYSLITRDHNGIRLHRLVQAVERARLGPKNQRRWVTTAVGLFRAAFPEKSGDHASWAVCQRLLPHILVATEHARRLEVAGEQVGWLLASSAEYLLGRGLYRQAKPLAEQALTVTAMAGTRSSARSGRSTNWPNTRRRLARTTPRWLTTAPASARHSTILGICPARKNSSSRRWRSARPRLARTTATWPPGITTSAAYWLTLGIWPARGPSTSGPWRSLRPPCTPMTRT
jgi:hypothetical protein